MHYKNYHIPAKTDFIFFRFPEDGKCWYSPTFVLELRTSLEKALCSGKDLIIFEALNTKWDDSVNGSGRELLKEGIALAELLSELQITVLFLGKSELRDGLAGLFLASDLKFCINDCSLKYTDSPCFGEITSIKGSGKTNPVLLLSGAVDYNSSEMKQKGLLCEIFDSYTEWSSFLSELTGLSSTSMTMIKELVSNESSLNFRQGNLMESKYFGLRHSQPDCGEGLRKFLENRNK